MANESTVHNACSALLCIFVSIHTHKYKLKTRTDLLLCVWRSRKIQFCQWRVIRRWQSITQAFNGPWPPIPKWSSCSIKLNCQLLYAFTENSFWGDLSNMHLLKSSMNTVLSSYHLLRWLLITQMTQKSAVSLFSHDESSSSFMLQALISAAPFIPGSASSLFLKIVNQFRENYAHKQLVRNRAREREMIGMIRWLEWEYNYLQAAALLLVSLSSLWNYKVTLQAEDVFGTFRGHKSLVQTNVTD